MESLVEAIETNQVYVRAIVENANSNGLENRVGIDIFEKELARRGLSEYFEVRFFDGRLHAKSILIDDVLLIVGSQNLHYSSYGKGGLLEYSVATDSPEAIQTYQEMFEYYWDLAIPADEAEFVTTAN
jgi:phosphatidylserine/phosphatidylglycerophosphate/cardiolipin synthase-like enzyme